MLLYPAPPPRSSSVTVTSSAITLLAGSSADLPHEVRSVAVWFWSFSYLVSMRRSAVWVPRWFWWIEGSMEVSSIWRFTRSGNEKPRFVFAEIEEHHDEDEDNGGTTIIVVWFLSYMIVVVGYCCL